MLECIFEQILLCISVVKLLIRDQTRWRKTVRPFIINLLYIRVDRYFIHPARLLSVFGFHRLVYLRVDFFFICASYQRNDITSKCLCISEVNTMRSATAKWGLV